MRANLGAGRNRSTLEQEIETATIYERIEKLRLGDRLNVRWDIDDLPMQTLIPSLTVQPMLENAIFHGIELLPEGGEVRVTGKRENDDLVITIENPVAVDARRTKPGNKMALGNIRQRYELAYGNRASVDVESRDDWYSVRIRFPAGEAES